MINYLHVVLVIYFFYRHPHAEPYLSIILFLITISLTSSYSILSFYLIFPLKLKLEAK